MAQDRQDAMTSKQAMLWASAWACLALGLAATVAGCAKDYQADLVTPYGERRVWAVAPFRNDSGTLHADGVAAADHLVRQLAQVDGLDVLPLNRTLEAMQTLGVGAIGSASDAAAVRELLGVDGLVVGSVTSYDPYDPPTFGLSLELHTDPSATPMAQDFDLDGLRRLQSRSVGDGLIQTRTATGPRRQPVVSVGALFDARSARVVERVQGYARERGRGGDDPAAYRLYLISMDLFTEFVSFEVASRLVLDETIRQASLRPDDFIPLTDARP
ncbi:MAG: hypothetical protein AAF612_08680 [Planctomycetota bacterium]